MSNTLPSPLACLQCEDCIEALKKIDSNSVHIIVTDPPYFIHNLDDKWSPCDITKSCKKANIVKGLPVGMAFNKNQGKSLQSFLVPISVELFRIIKPGGFMLMFAFPRLYHRAAVAVEDAGFEIRDCLAWHFTKRAQCKAFTMDHFVLKSDKSEQERQKILQSLKGRRTPQLRPQFESIMLAQKPKEGTFVTNWMTHRTGLVDMSEQIPCTLMHYEKEDKGPFNFHLTPKPLKLLESMIKLFSEEGQIVLDPFVGSGSTCLAAQSTGRRSIGIDINPQYIAIAQQRLEGNK